VPGFSAVISYGLAAPAGTPRPIVDRLNKELQTALADPALRKRLDAEGGQVLPGTPEDYAKMLDDEEKKWGPLVKGLNLKMD
jgi:tripartite-type tricarboxylate transporter receptor subunit TctC